MSGTIGEPKGIESMLAKWGAAGSLGTAAKALLAGYCFKCKAICYT